MAACALLIVVRMVVTGMYTPRRDHGDGRMYTPRHGHDDDAHDRDDAQIILRFLHHARERDGLHLRSTDPHGVEMIVAFVILLS